MATLAHPHESSWQKPIYLLIPITLLAIFIAIAAALALRPQFQPPATPLSASWLPDDSEIQVSLPPNAPTRRYVFNGNPLNTTLVTLESAAPTFAFRAEIMDEEETLIAAFDSRLQIAALALMPYDGAFEIAISSVDEQTSGAVNLAIGDSAARSGSAPAAIMSKSLPQCEISNSLGGEALIRSAPASEYDPLGTLSAQMMLPVLGRTDDGWLAVNYGERQGWVRGDVVSLNGQCEALTHLTNPTVPVAAVDAEAFLLEFDRDSSGQFRDSISTPQGDASDLVWLRAINLNSTAPNNYREFTLTMNCSGAGAQHLRWGSPYEPTLRCGESARLPFIFNLNQQPITIIVEPNAPQSYIEYEISVGMTGAVVDDAQAVG
jgi:hypothetical protein